MWKNSGEDPGGGPSQISDLEDQLEQQQVLIAQLKEVIRKSSNLTVEKVDEYMNILTKMSGRVKHKKTDTGKRGTETAASEKINLLRQQLEENKAKLAERGKNQKGIEEMVSQLKEQLDNSQNSINTSNLEKLDYNSSSSSEELYNILLVKERRITDLMEKTQKLENQVLDLQENVKEKDNVIDARTKAITLMTENLSRKRKTTVDALDDTKEQMRKMQETFVKLEGEMKARQLKLLDDLKAKNYEIAELQEDNKKLKENQVNSEEKVKEKQELLKKIQEEPDLDRLKKQLEESNKNMIKVKAQHKGKLKELNKKIEEFVKLENENCRMQQKIAELEEEKGSLQLKLVEMENGRGSNEEKLLAEFETVKSEISTIDLEEKLDNLESEKKKLMETNEHYQKEMENLLEKLDLINKEKQETQTKLEQYIHENMELIDKLEKLSSSTEKVSSAESIEIVENLTQQEKLELATYEKNNITIKEEEENLQQNIDLNDSVNELTEETSELLQKIELFTIERREVMEKMEVLQQENIKLNLKLKEIENNRDILEETYEQLQNEKEKLTEKLEDKNANNDYIRQLEEELTNNKLLIKDYQQKIEENLELQVKVKELESESGNVENKLMKLENLNKDKSEEVCKLIKERDNLQQVIQENDKEFHKKMNEFKEKYLTLQEQLEKNSDSIDNIKNPLNRKIDELTMKNKEQLEKMKKIAANLKKKSQVNQEIEEKLKEIEGKYQKEMEEKANILENNFKMENRNMELQNIIIDLKSKLEKNEINLQQELLLKEEMNENKYEMKLKEYELLNENREFELKTAKERINNLEQEFGELEEKRLINEKKIIDLQVELNEARELSEKILHEKDKLENQLKSMEIIEENNRKDMEELLKENQELYKNYQKIQEINSENEKKFEEEKMKINYLNNEKLEEFEEKLMEMKQITDKYEWDFGQLQENYAKIQKENEEMEKMNNDYQRKFDDLFREKHDLQMKQQEFCEELKEKSENLNVNEMEIEKLTKEMEKKNEDVVEMQQKFQELAEQCENYRKQITQLEDELLKKTAENTIDAVLIEAKQKVNSPPLFKYQWTDQSEDPFNFVKKEEEKTSECVEELHNKVKTLEFMLFNVEKEKDEALVQCNKLSEELTRLVYDREEISKVADTIETEYLAKIEEKEVTEESIVPKTAYLCYSQEEEEDGWGLPQDEVKSEEDNKLDDLKEKIKVLEMERLNHLEEIKQLQIKSGKLIKKLKEFKQKNEQLIKNDDNLLNDAIQEEFKLQIKQIEKQLNDTKAELDREKLEKQTIVKKLETVTVLSERLKENKERQDVDVLTWQRNCNDLMRKLEKFEWGQEFNAQQATDENPELNKKINELNETIKELTIDNEELQLLLEEQRNLRVQAEKSAKDNKEINEKLQQLEKEKEELLNSMDEQEFKLCQVMARNDELRYEKKQVFDNLIESEQEMKKLKTEKETIDELDKDLMKNWEPDRKEKDLINKLKEAKETIEKLEQEIVELEREMMKDWEPDREKKDSINKLKEAKETIEKLKQEIVELETEQMREWRLMEKNRIEMEEIRENIIPLEQKALKRIEFENKIKLELELKSEEKIGLFMQRVEKENRNLYDSLMEQNRIDNKETYKKLTQLEEERMALINKLDKNKSELKQKEEIIEKLEKEKSELLNNLQEKCVKEKQLENEISVLTNELLIVKGRIGEVEELVKNKNEIIEILEKEKNCQQLNIDQSKVDELEKQKLEYENKIELLINEYEIKVNQRGSDVAESWKMHLDVKENEFVHLEQQLKKELNEFEEKCNGLVNENNELRKNVDREIQNEIDKITMLQQQINDRQLIINELNRNLQETTQELSKSKQEFDDNWQELVKIRQESQAKSQELEEYKLEVQNLKGNREILQGTINERNDTISMLNEQLQEMQNLKDYENENIANLQQNLQEVLQNRNEEIASLQEEKERQINYLKESLENDQKSIINEYLKEIDGLREQLRDNEEVHRELSLKLDEKTEEINVKIEEYNQYIDNLQKEKEQQLNYVSECIENENKTLINEYIKEVDGLKQMLNEKDEEMKQIIDKLQAEKEQELISVRESVENEILTALKAEKQGDEEKIEEETKQLRGIIEEQVLKIEELKEKLYEKSNDYDSIIAQMDLSQIKSQITREVEGEDNLREPVNRAELDLALYMLHQRDVRCEELTMELTQLLEERDTLQLKLSNVIREKEDLFRRMKETDKDETIDGETDNLATKLSELKTVGYKKDKTIVDEQEHRRMQELSIMQQHKDVAAKLPAEAAARLVDASYTLSRDVQSPSKVILNWLWGRSTPKVNDI